MGLRARLSESQEWGILSGFVQLCHCRALVDGIYPLPVWTYSRAVRILASLGGN